MSGALGGVLVLSGCGASSLRLAPIERKELHPVGERAHQARVRALRKADRIAARWRSGC